MSDTLNNKNYSQNKLLYEIEIKHLTNDLRLTKEEYETSKRKYFEIYNKLATLNEQLQEEIKEKKQTKEALAVRLRYEECLANFSRVLLTAEEDSINKALQHLLTAAEVSRVYIYENFLDEKDGLCMLLKYETCAKNVKPSINNPEFRHIPYNQGFKRWSSELAKRNSIIGSIEDLTKTEQKILKSRSIASIVILPIYVNEKWYGFIGFDDIFNKRKWGQIDIRMLETASEIIGVFLERKGAEEKLKRAKKLAEEANQLKSQFVFNVSHEMRTPLNSIIGFTESILKSQAIEKIQQYSITVLHQADMLLMLISDLLDMAKIEAGKMNIESKSFDLYKLLERFYTSLRVQTQTKGLELKIEIGQGVFRYLIGDELRILQVLMNLGGNAVKFTEKGSIIVKVESLSNDGKSTTLKFSVIDTGIGIPKEKQQDIFKSFTQADGSITRKYGGTGLGITIARQLVELMGGLSGVESEPDKGSHFWFAIPLEIISKEEITAKHVVESKLSIDSLKIKPGYILLAEDYQPNKQVALMHLENAGYTVDTVKNGIQAVAVCNEKKYDLILMDVQMPELDGYEATRKIRTGKSRNKNVPIIALTAYADVTSKKNCREAGMNDIIVKPIKRESFLTMVNNWLPGQSTLKHTKPSDRAEKKGKKATVESVPMDYEKAIFEFGGNKMVLDNAIKQFIEDLSNQILIFKNAIKTNDVEKFRTEAHRIRGGAANLTAMKLAAYAEQMEEMAINGKLDKARGCLNEFEKEFKKLKVYILKQYKN